MPDYEELYILDVERSNIEEGAPKKAVWVCVWQAGRQRDWLPGDGDWCYEQQEEVWHKLTDSDMARIQAQREAIDARIRARNDEDDEDLSEEVGE